MIVYIKTLDGLYQPLFCSEEDTVEELKDRWGEKYGINELNQRLIFASTQLVRYSTLRELGIRNESVLYQARRLGGDKQWPDRKLECAICFEEFTRLAVLPCKHTGVCHGCVANLDQCPMCRALI